MEVTGTNELHRAITADMRDMQDVAQTLAVVAAFASGDTTIDRTEKPANKRNATINSASKRISLPHGH